MARQSPQQKQVVARVMQEFKDGELEQRNGATVENPKQAIAIALRESGSSNQETPAKNKANLRKTIRRERPDKAEPTRATLYDEAKRRDVPGRSTMRRTYKRRWADAIASARPHRLLCCLMLAK